MKGWGHVFLRFAACGAALCVLAYFVVEARREGELQARKRIVLEVNLMAHGWAPDNKDLPRNYELRYVTRIHASKQRVPNQHTVTLLYKPLWGEQVRDTAFNNDEARVWTDGVPRYVIHTVRMNSERAILGIGGDVTQQDVEAMIPGVLDLCLDVGIDASDGAVRKDENNKQYWFIDLIK
jgi:hypothetical protein